MQLQVVCNVAEAPEGRELLQQAGAPLRKKLALIHKEAEQGQLKRAAAEAIRQCRFTCFPGEPAEIADRLERGKA